MLELNRAMRAANLGHEGRTVPGLNVWLSCKFGGEHDEIICNDRIEFIVIPGPSDLIVICHQVAHIIFSLYSLRTSISGFVSTDLTRDI